MFIADIQYVYLCCYLNKIFNILIIENILSQDTEVLGCTINNLINFVVSIKTINIKLINLLIFFQILLKYFPNKFDNLFICSVGESNLIRAL